MSRAFKYIRKSIIFSSVMLISSALLAGTVVEIKSDNEISTLKTDGKQARIDTGGGDGNYVIIDYKSNSVKAVDNRRRQVMLLNIDDMPKTGKPPKINTSISSLGAGPTIAGYDTEKFTYKVNGKSCGIIYGSKKAYQLKGIKDLFNAMRTMAQRQQAMMGGYAGMVDACTLGDFEMSKHVARVGVPMRTEEKGIVDSEIQSIKLNVKLPANTFAIPASYKTVTIKDEMQKANKEMKKMQQQYQPQMEQMMRQMQQSGQMTPEAMEQMRRAQEMMKQYQTGQ